MSLRTAIASRVAEHLTSARRLEKRRRKAERARSASGAPHVVEYFHQVDDPYSVVAAQALRVFLERYETELRCWVVGPPADWAAPERAMLAAYGRKDAARLARSAGFDFPENAPAPASDAVAAAADALAGLDGPAFLDRAIEVGGALARGEPISAAPGAGAGAAAIRAGEARRAALKHFMSAMIFYGGEWCWGVDRLHYLEARLAELGTRRAGAPKEPIYAPPETPRGRLDPAGEAAELHWYLSFRSPYTYISAERVKRLADAYGARLRLRFVLPMVMRGLPVPRMKGMYFALDTAREARRVGVPFGRIADPLGRPVERGYSLLPWARDEGRGFEYCLSFLRGVWARGVDAGSDAGIKTIVADAGLDWSEAKNHLDGDGWRAEAEANRRELTELGLWGVPSFRVGTTAVWGQDRLWTIEDALRREAGVEGRQKGEI